MEYLNKEVLTVIVITLLWLFCVIGVVRFLSSREGDDIAAGNGDEITTLTISPDGKHVQKDSRYLQKKATRFNKDIDRVGRFKITRPDGTSATKVGKLSTILKFEDVKTYKEIM